MICPHCGFKTPPFKAHLVGGEKAAPKVGNYSLCLECSGFSIIIGPDSLRKATKAEYELIRNAPELLLLGRLREYAYRLHCAAEVIDLGKVRNKRKK